MKKIITAILIAALMAAVLSCGFAEEAFQEANSSVAAGYYVSPFDDVLLLADGTMHIVSTDDPSEETGGTYKVLSDGERFIIETSYGAYLCLVPLPEKEPTDTGGVYYAGYSNYIGTADQGFDEGSQVRFGDFVFDNDYTVVAREPLSVFFGISDNGKIEGPGYDSPEEAVTAYIRALQRNDLAGMLSTFAVETFVDCFDLAKEMKRLQKYSIIDDYIPNTNAYTRHLNVEKRRSNLVEDIRNQYLTFTKAKIATVRNPFDGCTMEDGMSGEDFLASAFETNDQPILSRIEFSGEFLDPDAILAAIDAESVSSIEKAMAETNSIMLDSLGADEIRLIIARLRIANQEYFLYLPAIRYGSIWYNYRLLDHNSHWFGMTSFSGGLAPYPVPETED